MSNEEIIEVVSALKANDKTMKDSGISDNLWGKAVECIVFLQSENASLCERLSRAAELPCKVGDTIFYVQYFCDYKGCDSTTQQFCCGCKEMIERERRKEKYVICEKSFVLKDLEEIGKKYFTTPEAAKAHLTELKGGNKDE